MTIRGVAAPLTCEDQLSEAAVLARHGRVLLEEQFVGRLSRWHPLTADATVPDLGRVSKA
jgi:hypothetical protein